MIPSLPTNAAPGAFWPDPPLLPSAAQGLRSSWFSLPLLSVWSHPAQMTLLGVPATPGGAPVSTVSLLGTRPPTVVRKKGVCRKSAGCGFGPSPLPEGWLPPLQGTVALCSHPTSTVIVSWCPSCFL